MKKIYMLLLSFVVTVIQIKAQPVFTGDYSTVLLGCNSSSSAIGAALGTATATDACGGVTLTFSTGSVVMSGCISAQTRVFKASDACGNTASVSRTAVWTFDVTPPVLTGNFTSVNLGTDPSASGIEAALSTATASDNCSTPTIVSSDGTVLSSGCNRSQIRTFNASDPCGNTTTVSRTVTWTVSSSPIVFTGNYSSVSLGCNPSESVISAALGSATATGGCSAPTITHSTGAVVASGCNRSQTRAFTASDGFGNTAIITRSVIWIVDVTAPVFSGSYLTINLGGDPSPSDMETALGTASAVDNCATPVITSSDGIVQSKGCNRMQTRTFVSTDICNNTATVSRTIEWKQGCELMISIGDITVLESAGTVLVPVTLSSPFSSVVTVNYKTVNGTARHPKDYISGSGTITFLAGQTTQDISITIVANNIAEEDEDFFISLSQPANAIIDNGNSTVTIIESSSPLRIKNNYLTETQHSDGIKLVIPNPQSKKDVLKIYGLKQGNFDVIITDVQGKIIADLKGYQNNWSLARLAPGLYFYQVLYKNEKNELRKLSGKLFIKG